MSGSLLNQSLIPYLIPRILLDKRDDLIALRSQPTPSAAAAVQQARPHSSTPPHELDTRIRSLTQSLVHKQTALEAATADRNALRIQLETVERQFRDALQSNAAQSQAPRRHASFASASTRISVNDTDDAKSTTSTRLPLPLWPETPFDTRVSRRMKRAYSSLDAVGVHVGDLLRRYPLLRMLVIFYVVLLHLWVMVVLCTSAPN